MSAPLDGLEADGDDPLVGTVLAGRFHIVERIGVGGMGSVYRAEHVHMRKPVAVKVLHKEMTLLPEIVARFEREAIAAGRIEHPNVAKASDFGQLDDGSFYLVLEYVEGTDLADRLNEGPIPELDAVFISYQIAEALSAAHAAGIVHRDLKPENVMLITRPGEPMLVKVLDFGIAKVSMEELGGGEQLTKHGTVFGTPEYMAPEQAEGKGVDHRADVYTVGVLLHEMLAGTAPFEDDDMVRVLRMQIESPPPALPEWVDPELRALIARLLSKDPAARPQTAEELALALRAVLERHGGVPQGELSDEARELYESFSGQYDLDSLVEQSPTPGHARAETAGSTAADDSVKLPVWALVVGGIALVAVAVGGTVAAVFALQGRGEAASGHSEHAGGAPSGVAPTPPAGVLADPKDEELAARAATGDEEAMKLLEARPEGTRTAAVWLALARGRMKTRDHVRALAAYEHALELDPTLAQDQQILRDVRQAARDKTSEKDAVALAAKRLGPGGADVLYDVWTATKAKTPTTQLAKELVYGEDERAEASPALNVVLDLREAETCAEIRELLPRVTLNGDARALRVLRPLQETTGCGAGEKEDCWECLREDDALEGAIKAVRTRPGPRF